MTASTSGTGGENPLVPNSVLARIYGGMQMLRAAGAARRTQGEQMAAGEEPARASSLVSLESGDLISDGAPTVTDRRQRSGRAMAELASGAQTLPPIASAEDRLLLAVGAGAALRAQGKGRLVLGYARADEMPAAGWKRVLRAAGAGEVPVVFLLLPAIEDGRGRQGLISQRAQGWGVPGMPVDAADAIALYRVMQESVLRVRGGDGPALLECVEWRVAGAKDEEAVDGFTTLRRAMRQRGMRAAR